MMGIRPDRLWAVAGAVVASLLLGLTYFLAIAPQHAQTREFHAQTRVAKDKSATLQRRLVELRRQNGRLPEFQAKLAQDRQALPTTSGMSDFLRELETTAAATGVSVTTLIVGAAAPVTTVPGVFAVPLTLTVTGSTANFPHFLDRLQGVEPRAVLIGSLSVVPDGTSENLGGPVTVTVTMQAFVAPPAAPAATEPKPDE